MVVKVSVNVEEAIWRVVQRWLDLVAGPDEYQIEVLVLVSGGVSKFKITGPFPNPRVAAEGLKGSLNDFANTHRSYVGMDKNGELMVCCGEYWFVISNTE